MLSRRRFTPQYITNNVQYAARHYVGGVDYAAYDEGRSLRTVAAILVIAFGMIMGMGVMFCSKAQAMSVTESMSQQATEGMSQQSMLQFIESNLGDRAEALASLYGKSQTEQGITIAALGSTYCSESQATPSESLSAASANLESAPVATANAESVGDLELASELTTDEDGTPVYWTYQPEQGDTIQGDTIVKGDGKTVIYPGLVLHVETGVFHITDPSIIYDDGWDSKGFDIIKNSDTGLYEAVFWENHLEMEPLGPIEIRPNGSIMKCKDGSLVMQEGYVQRPDGTILWITHYFHPNNGVRWHYDGLEYGFTSTPVAIVHRDGTIEITNQCTIDTNDHVTFNWGVKYTLPAGSTLEDSGDIQLPNGVRLYTDGTASLPDGTFVDSWDQVPPDDQLPPAPNYDELTIDDSVPSAAEDVAYEPIRVDKAELSESATAKTEVEAEVETETETEVSEASEATPVDAVETEASEATPVDTVQPVA